MNIKKEEWTYLNKKIKKWGQLIVEAKDGNLLDDRNIYHQPRKAPSIIDPKLYFCVMMNGDPRGGIGGGYDVRSFCWCTERNRSIITRMVSSAGLALTKRKGMQACMHAGGGGGQWRLHSLYSSSTVYSSSCHFLLKNEEETGRRESVQLYRHARPFINP